MSASGADDTSATRESGSSRVIAVLGMHRSGTSWLAGSLEELGVELGEVSTANPHNKKGNRESKVLMSLHDAVLRDNDGSWKRPPKTREWTEEQKATLREFAAGMNLTHPLWGFKDPRALLFLDTWRAELPHIECIGIYRHPRAVHRSLHARSERFTERKSFRVWKAYNNALLDEYQRRPFPLLCFDRQQTLDAQLRKAVRQLGLPGADRAASFFDATLVHNDSASLSVPLRCRGVWSRLEAARLPV